MKAYEVINEIFKSNLSYRAGWSIIEIEQNKTGNRALISLFDGDDINDSRTGIFILPISISAPECNSPQKVRSLLETPAFLNSSYRSWRVVGYKELECDQK